MVFVVRSFGFRALSHRGFLTDSRTVGLLRADGNLNATRTRCAANPLPALHRAGASVRSCLDHEGKRMRMGRSVASTIVGSHEESKRVENRTRGGSTLRVRLPLVHDGMVR